MAGHPVAPPSPLRHTRRIGWGDLPRPLREAFTHAMGADVAREDRQTGGWSPGMASRLTLQDGRRIFLKAISADRDPHAPDLYRREATTTAALPDAAPAPRLRWTYDAEGWVALALDDIDGRMPAQPWRRDDLDLVVQALAVMADALTPAPDGTLPIGVDLADNFSSWRRLAGDRTGGTPQAVDRLPAWARDNLDQLAALEADWAAAAAGNTLSHTDLRADNILITAGGVKVVDWAYAVASTPWTDLLLMLPSVAASSRIDPEPIWHAFPRSRNVPDDQANAVLAALAGDFLTQSLRTAPPNIPGLRQHQRAKGEAALRWLRTRLATTHL
ncbi:hypothetical protein Arub01_47000 [Actinomadura rubrobrunea]|uniref:Aminoglycoside phosphotransferase family protein n=2 Tax=Actinomadura rubrobrunea TaxID=115335 RepID=A0A9W6Q0T5_9ACTN|nr:hypothetical protein Arub01_47000 [Actinomadura rubrobrunea]